MATRSAALTTACIVLVVAGGWSADAAPRVKCQTNDQPVERRFEEYLDWLGEEDLQGADCAAGRETYREIIYEFHLGRSGTSTRIDIIDGRASATFKETSTVIMDGEVPKLEKNNSKDLTPRDVDELRRAFASTDFWSKASPIYDPKSGCVPNGMIIVEVVRDGRYHRYESDGCRAGPKDMGALYDQFNKLKNELER